MGVGLWIEVYGVIAVVCEVVLLGLVLVLPPFVCNMDLAAIMVAS